MAKPSNFLPIIDLELISPFVFVALFLDRTFQKRYAYTILKVWGYLFQSISRVFFYLQLYHLCGWGGHWLTTIPIKTSTRTKQVSSLVWSYKSCIHRSWWHEFASTLRQKKEQSRLPLFSFQEFKAKSKTSPAISIYTKQQRHDNIMGQHAEIKVTKILQVHHNITSFRKQIGRSTSPTSKIRTTQ